MDAAVVMPPSLEAEAAGVVVGVARDLAESSRFYAQNAVDVARRAAMAEAESLAGGVEFSLDSILGSIGSSSGSWGQDLPYAGRQVAWAVPRSALPAASVAAS